MYHWQLGHGSNVRSPGPCPILIVGDIGRRRPPLRQCSHMMVAWWWYCHEVRCRWYWPQRHCRRQCLTLRLGAVAASPTADAARPSRPMPQHTSTCTSARMIVGCGRVLYLKCEPLPRCVAACDCGKYCIVVPLTVS
jgi:hypothetical protein